MVVVLTPPPVEPGLAPMNISATAMRAGRLWGRPTEPGWTPQIGEKVTLSVRPEALHLIPLPDARNVFTGDLVRAIYLGDTAQYELRTERIGTIRLSQANPRFRHLPNGGTVHASADPEDVVMLRH